MMIEPKAIKSRITVWRLDKHSVYGFVKERATLIEGRIGNEIIYDNPIPEKSYNPKCDVCLAQEQGYSCERLVQEPGTFESQGGCMDCQWLCRKPPVHIGIRNYCPDHLHILNKKIGIGTYVESL
jgi:hypothetical protein